jgi:transketolase
MAEAKGLAKGAYVLASFGEGAPEIILMASGSEVLLIHGAAQRLAAEGHSARVVSFPSWRLFEEQTNAYRESVLPRNAPIRLAVEAGVSQGWERYVGPDGRIIGIDHFGASAPYAVIFEHFGLTVDSVYTEAKKLLEASARALAGPRAGAALVSKAAKLK